MDGNGGDMAQKMPWKLALLAGFVLGSMLFTLFCGVVAVVMFQFAPDATVPEALIPLTLWMVEHPMLTDLLFGAVVTVPLAVLLRELS